MNISGSGSKTGDLRSVSMTLRGEDLEFIHLIDELDRLATESGSKLIKDIRDQINWTAGQLVDHPQPAGVLTIKA